MAGRKFSRDSLEKRGFALWASLLFLGALSLRLYLGYSSEGFTTDLDTFKSWLTWPIPWALGRSITRTFSWTIPRLSVCAGVFREAAAAAGAGPWRARAVLPAHQDALYPGGPVSAGGAVLLLAQRKLGEKSALLLSGAYLFCPAVFLNSANGARRTPSARPLCCARCCCSTGSAACPRRCSLGCPSPASPRCWCSPLYICFFRPQAAAVAEACCWALALDGWGRLLLAGPCPLPRGLTPTSPFPLRPPCRWAWRQRGTIWNSAWGRR